MKHMLYDIWLHNLPCIITHPSYSIHFYNIPIPNTYSDFWFDRSTTHPFIFYDVSNDSLAKYRLSGDGAHILQAWLGT